MQNFLILFHLITILFAGILFLFPLFLKKGSNLHKIFGIIWCTLMIISSISTFFIHQINKPNGYSWIHILSIITLVSVSYGFYTIIKNKKDNHKYQHFICFVGPYIGLLIAAFFAIFAKHRYIQTNIFQQLF